jgi:hypothetical protein
VHGTLNADYRPDQFGLAYLLGIELMPRIRRWRKLKLYRPDRNRRYSSIDALFTGSVDWPLIGEHYPLLIQLALAIQSGKLAPSAVLARINSYSTRNRLTNDPADQEKAVVYNELVANAVALQNVVDQTHALHALKSEGARISSTDLAFLSPYATSKIKRFGDYPTHLKPDPMPQERIRSVRGA